MPFFVDARRVTIDGRQYLNNDGNINPDWVKYSKQSPRRFDEPLNREAVEYNVAVEHNSFESSFDAQSDSCPSTYQSAMGTGSMTEAPILVLNLPCQKVEEMMNIALSFGASVKEKGDRIYIEIDTTTTSGFHHKFIVRYKVYETVYIVCTKGFGKSAESIPQGTTRRVFHPPEDGYSPKRFQIWKNTQDFQLLRGRDQILQVFKGTLHTDKLWKCLEAFAFIRRLENIYQVPDQRRAVLRADVPLIQSYLPNELDEHFQRALTTCIYDNTLPHRRFLTVEDIERIFGPLSA